LTLSALSVSAEPVGCQKAAAQDEIAICKRQDLRLMDGEVDRAYRAARERWTASMSNSVKVMRQDWLKERRKCGSDETCLMNRMIDEIKALDAMRPSSPTWILDGSKPAR
jgi:uncharacterized protein